MRNWGHLRLNRAGGVGTIFALLLPVLLGIVGLGTEYSYALVKKAEDQRVADAAAYSGAIAYIGSSNPIDGTAAMQAAGQGIAALHAVRSQDVDVALVASPNGSGNMAVRVRIADRVPRLFSRMISAGSTLPLSAQAVVELRPDSQRCVIALQAVAGQLAASIGLDGGAVINALLCAVTANAAVTVPCGTGINTARLSFNSALPPDAPCNGIQAPAGQVLRLLRKQVTDPYAADAGIVGANLRVATTLLQLSPLPPVVVGLTNVQFGSNALSTRTQATLAGCTAALSGKQWTMSCTASAITFGTLTVDSGYSLNFTTAASGAGRYSFSGALVNNGLSLVIGPGTFTIAQGIRVAAGATTSIGSGSVTVGNLLATACTDGGVYSVCNAGTLTLLGPTSLTASGGVYNGRTATVTIGSGSANSIVIGSSSNGNAVRAAQGALTVVGGSGGDQKYTGNIVMDGGGGSCLNIGAAPNHDIHGSVRTADATIFGAGTYTVTGSLLLGINGAVDALCGGVATGVSADGVTFVVGGSGLDTPLTGPCAGDSFCVAPGYQNVTLVAPQTGLLAKVAVVGPALNASGALFSSGLNNTTLSGLFYVPLGPVTISGGAGIGAGLGQCLELVVGQLLVQHGSIFAAPCKTGGPTTQTAVLID